MKKQILTLLSILCVQSMFSQMAVYDASANATAVETKATAAQTLAKTTAMLKELTILKEKYNEMRDDVEMVSDVISTGMEIQKLITTLSNMNNNVETAVNYIYQQSLISTEEKIKLIDAFYILANKGLDALDKATDVVTTGNYKMTDAERLNILNETLKEVNRQNNIIIYFFQKLKSSVNNVKQKKNNTRTVNKLYNDTKR
ncbi:hypothetical protein Q361_1178 [Flavobacterium croceum DSM 17960]|uniref:UBA domain-containing protein n=1 Tax=Flavobacterium croceum DSM 17960 TaxID=1121886 RepID=A0A2S4N5C8_9FLAO|nr:hypothetical protein [Flavobacterium croceum]POS00905.1 hypothetical protein Q361_1178 [Flavobacterium croceum DSM 17960]